MPALMVLAGSGLAAMIVLVPLEWSVFACALAVLSIVLVKYPAVYLGLHVSGLVAVGLAWAGLRETTGWSLAMVAAVGILAWRTAERWREWLSVAGVSQAAFALLMVCSLTWAPESGGYSLEKVRQFVGWAFIPFVGVIACGLCGRLKQFAYSFFACILALTLASLAQPTALWGDPTAAEQARLTVFFYDPIGLGRLAAVSLILAVWVAMWARRRTWSIASLALVPAILAALALTQTRGALAAAAGGLLVLVAMAGRGLRTLIMACVLVVAAAVALQLTPLPASERYRILVTPDRLLLSSSVSERLLLFDEAWHLWLESPVAGMGVGAGGRYMTFRYPHNIILELAAELGIVGIALFVVLVGALVRRSVQALRDPSRRPHQVLYLGCFAAALLAAQFSYDIQRNALVWVFAALALANASEATASRLGAPAMPALTHGMRAPNDTGTQDPTISLHTRLSASGRKR